ncbi:MAG: Flp pilus assembly complex ATPase component TadA [Planctomycetes bacterium]|nr:Flp pilus assembly complex ATPase component TadA [Planctomycetota bacterium]
MTRSLGETLVASGVLSEAQLREAQSFQRNGDLSLPAALQKLGLADETEVARAWAKLEGLPFVDLSKAGLRVADELLERVPAELAREQGLLPVLEKGGRLIVAVDDPFKRMIADQLAFTAGGEVACALAAPGPLRRAIRRFYGESAEEAVAAKLGGGAQDDEGDAPIVRLVTRMFQEALGERASDIHIEPGHGRVRIRYRVDGMLRDVAQHPEHLHAPLISRLKIMARMDIAEKRKPQDGRIGVTIEGREIDVRASILPSNHGETMVMRLLDRSASLISLRELGFDDEDYAWFRRVIARPHGICLVTGPTGSGKTTTLYAALSELNRPDVKIITAEDPVEYHIPGINQVQVNARIGVTFARILKAMLRCAPNVILVGEIRDLETAEIAIQASLTGHLVFSTVHTNDAPSALTRLADLGVKPFLVSAAVQFVMAQRLVRRLCSECSEAYEPHPEEVRSLGLDPALLAGQKLRRPRGCRRCEGSGYHGRVAIFELLEMNHELRELCFRGAPLDVLRAAALSSGSMRPLIRDGARKAIAGQTSVTEVLRVCRDEDAPSGGAA